MYRKSRRLLGHIAFAGVFALLPPAIAAGANMAMTADISSDNSLRPSIVSNEVVAMGAVHADDPVIATHAPVRLSPLAGNDTVAWDSANSVRVWHRHPVK
jgi:hypothetical protein